MFFGEGPHIFREKKSKSESRKLNFNDMLHPLPVYGEISSFTTSLSFSFFSLLKEFLQAPSGNFEALISVEFNFILQSCSSNSRVI